MAAIPSTSCMTLSSYSLSFFDRYLTYARFAGLRVPLAMRSQITCSRLCDRRTIFAFDRLRMVPIYGVMNKLSRCIMSNLVLFNIRVSAMSKSVEKNRLTLYESCVTKLEKASTKFTLVSTKTPSIWVCSMYASPMASGSNPCLWVTMVKIFTSCPNASKPRVRLFMAMHPPSRAGRGGLRHSCRICIFLFEEFSKPCCVDLGIHDA